jgi:hypothetical protein
MFVPYSSCVPSSLFVPSSIHILVSSYTNDNNEDENIPPSPHLPPDDSIEDQTCTRTHAS